MTVNDEATVELVSCPECGGVVTGSGHSWPGTEEEPDLFSWTGSPEQSIDVLADAETRICVCPTSQKVLDGFGDMRRATSAAGWLMLVSDEKSAAATE